KVIILLIAGPIAVFSNVIRILFLCIVAYHYGSEVAVGKLHDISGIGIFAVAFVMLFTAEALLRKYLPPRADDGPKAEPGPAPRVIAPVPGKVVCILGALLIAATAGGQVIIE